MAHLYKKVFFQQVRYLPRWFPRNPRSIIPGELYDSVNDTINEDTTQTKNVPVLDDTAAKRGPSKKPVQKALSVLSHKRKDAKNTNLISATFDSDGNFVYTKLSNKDIRVSKIMSMVRSKRGKEKDKLILLEGKTLIQEALQAGCKIDYILFSRLTEIEYLKEYLPKKDVTLLKMPYTEMKSWSDLVTSPGVMGVCHAPDTEGYVQKNPLPITVICDNIREPGNLGSILRTCCGVGCEKVILTKGCVDVWDTKVLRGSTGAHFKMKLFNKVNWVDIQLLLPQQYTVFIADNNTSPDSGKNVSNIPVIPYFGANFKTQQHIVLVIGGETEGISEESYKLARECQGIRLNIPLGNGLNSLNTGTALGVIIFEMKRQIINLNIETAEHYKIRNMSLNT